MITQIVSFLERQRLQHHFERVEHYLLANDTSTLTLQAKIERQQHIQHLREYRENGIFPRNHTHPERIPCFIDRDGRVCAVGHLLMTSGHSELAHKIALTDNNAYVKDMQFPELLNWANDAGLTVDELQAIQPGYSSQLVLSVAASPLTWVWLIAGSISILANVR